LGGVKAGLVAFVAFGLAYHEPGSPRLTWLFLLIPVALLKVVPEGTARKWINAWKQVATGLLVIHLVPFLAHQIQTAIYPQLEVPGVNFASREMFWTVGANYESAAPTYESAAPVADGEIVSNELIQLRRRYDRPRKSSRFESSNLLHDPQARIQTGPAQPQWSWNIVRCAWDGPVAADQTIKPILISMQTHRVLTVIRVLFLLLLGAILLGVRRIRPPRPAAALFALMLCSPLGHAVADEIPDDQMLQSLRERLLYAADVYPRAAEIAAVELNVEGNRVTMVAEIHTAIRVAVPLPGQLPVWSPVSVRVGEDPAEHICRQDGYLWIVLPKGVHVVTVESMLPDVSDWSWTFQLQPRRVSFVAPGWNVTGIRENGVPDPQVFFSRQQRASEEEAAYDRKEFNPIVAVDRHLEIGLVWQVRTEVTRLAANGQAVSLKVPLLLEESVLTSNVTVENGQIDVALGAGQDNVSWQSELPIGSNIHLMTTEYDSWVERWHLVTSPVWNLAQTGLPPVFETDQQNMIPTWYPWPGEETTLSFNKPEAVSGDIITVKQVDHSIFLESRQRTVKLNLKVESSIGSDFLIDMAPDAVISSLVHDGQAIPVRRDGGSLIVPVGPGGQAIEVTWKTNETMETTIDTGQVVLPVESSNATTVVHVPDS